MNLFLWKCTPEIQCKCQIMSYDVFLLVVLYVSYLVFWRNFFSLLLLQYLVFLNFTWYLNGFSNSLQINWLRLNSCQQKYQNNELRLHSLKIEIRNDMMRTFDFWVTASRFIIFSNRIFYIVAKLILASHSY